MMTELLFLTDAYMKTASAKVISVSEGSVQLDQTIFYPTGGGQPGDTGTLTTSAGETIAVIDTRKDRETGDILHMIGQPCGLSVGDHVTLAIDWDRRYAHMRVHTCLHVLSAILPYPVTGGSIGAEKGRLDFDMGDQIPDKQDLTTRLNDLIGSADHVTRTWITDEELDAKPELVKTMSVQPPRGGGKVRLVKISKGAETIDLQPCGGTHLNHISEIGTVEVAKIEKKGKQNRRIIVRLVAESAA